MRRNGSDNQEAALLRLAARARRERYVLRLYVTGLTPRSTRAIAILRAVCEAHLPGRYDLEVIDLYEHPELAQDEQIIAAPTLVRELPLPLRRLVGNLCDVVRVLVGLNLKECRG
jgi:circadian clock protein KaiB